MVRVGGGISNISKQVNMAPLSENKKESRDIVACNGSKSAFAPIMLILKREYE